MEWSNSLNKAWQTEIVYGKKVSCAVIDRRIVSKTSVLCVYRSPKVDMEKDKFCAVGWSNWRRVATHG